MKPTLERENVERRRITREVATVYVSVCVATALLGQFRAWPWASDLVPLGISALFLLIPLSLARREPAGARKYGIELGGLLEPIDEDQGPPGPLGIFELARTLWRSLPSATREFGVALAIAFIVFPPFALGFWFWNRPAHPFDWHVQFGDLPTFTIAQIVLVGLPEEALFRGYVQSRLHEAFEPRKKIFGVLVHPGVLVAQAALFALVHLAIDPHPAKLATFFPGLLFGWLRAWRGGIGAAIVFHAMSNLFAEILIRGWL
jgi:membrane protease YdiL (CAAX protease family)